MRTLGFIDRIIGARLFESASVRPSAAAAGGVAGLIYARPWYEIEGARAAVRQRPVAQSRSVASPSAPAASAEEALNAPAPSAFNAPTIPAPLLGDVASSAAYDEEAPAALGFPQGAVEAPASVSLRASSAPAMEHVVNRPAPVAPTGQTEARRAPAPEYFAAAAQAPYTEPVAAIPAAGSPSAHAEPASPAVQVAAPQVVPAVDANPGPSPAQVEAITAAIRAEVAATAPSAQASPMPIAIPAVSTDSTSSARAPVAPAAAPPSPGATAAPLAERAGTAPPSPGATAAPLAERAGTAPPAVHQSPAAIASASSERGSRVAATPPADEARNAAPPEILAAREVLAAASSAVRELIAAEIVGARGGAASPRAAGLPAALATAVDALPLRGSLPPASALGRAFAHIQWVDRQVVRDAPQAGRTVHEGTESYVLLAPDHDDAQAPVSAQRAAGRTVDTALAAVPRTQTSESPQARTSARAEAASTLPRISEALLPRTSARAEAAPSTSSFVAPGPDAVDPPAGVAAPRTVTQSSPLAVAGTPGVADAAPVEPLQAAAPPRAVEPAQSPAAPVAEATTSAPVASPASQGEPQAAGPYAEPEKTAASLPFSGLVGTAAAAVAAAPAELPQVGGSAERAVAELAIGRVGAAPRSQVSALQSSAMPELRASSALVAPHDRRASLDRFVDRLVGSRAARDARVLTVELPPLGASSLRAALAPVGEFVRLREERGPVTGRPAIASSGVPSPASYQTAFPRDLVASAAAPVRPGAGSSLAAPSTRISDAPSAPADRIAVAASPPRLELAPLLARAQASAPISSAEPLALTRPGGIGGRSEQLAGTIGIRAAGFSVDFIEPDRLPAMLASRGGALELFQRWSASAQSASGGPTFAPPGEGSRTMVAPWEAASASRSQGLGAAQGVAASFANAGLPVAGAPAVSGASPAVAPSPTSAPAVGGELAGGVDSWSQSPTAAAARNVTGPARSAVAESEAARRLDAVWSLIRVFPASAQGALTAAAADIAAGPRGRAMPLLSALASFEGGRAQAVAAEGASTVAGRPSTGGGVAAGPGARPAVAENISGRAPRALGAPASYVAGPAGARRVVGALDRTALPGGRMPRGGYLWSRSESFSEHIGDWAPPATVSAAQSGADAALAGHSSWEGMTPLSSQSVHEAFGDYPVGPGTSTARPARSGSLARPMIAGPGGAGAGQRTLRPEVAAASAMLQGDAASSLLQLVTASSGGSAAAASGSGSSSSSRAPQLSLVQPSSGPAVSSAPASESSARILDALRSQQQNAPSDDRVTLADLTLVAAASSTHQLAASDHVAQSAPHNASHSSAGSAKASGGEKESPEAERRKIESMARDVLEEVYRMSEVGRERSGD
ncbi:MAG: hypothetical protein EXR72_08635 [Myxococcales bacterium]|nr:hypothetical protein [Myxococcales bacterium]